MENWLWKIICCSCPGAAKFFQRVKNELEFICVDSKNFFYKYRQRDIKFTLNSIATFKEKKIQRAIAWSHGEFASKLKPSRSTKNNDWNVKRNFGSIKLLLFYFFYSIHLARLFYSGNKKSSARKKLKIMLKIIFKNDLMRHGRRSSLCSNKVGSYLISEK